MKWSEEEAEQIVLLGNGKHSPEYVKEVIVKALEAAFTKGYHQAEWLIKNE